MDTEKNKSKTRRTRQKSLILACLEENDHRHITAEDIAETLRKRGEAVGIATVYRNLKQLEAENVVKRYCADPRGGSCYRYIGEKSSCGNHFHLICSDCGCVVHAEDCDIKDTLDAIGQRYNFSIDNERTVFYGLCAKCKSKGTIKDEK